MKHIKLLVVAIAIALAHPAMATTCDVTEFSASGTLTAERLNQRLRQVEACLNGHVGNVNWNSSEHLANTNLANPNAIYSQSFVLGLTGASAPADITAANDMVVWRLPVSSTVIGMSVALSACSGCSVTVTLQSGAASIKSFAGIWSTSTQTDFGLSSAVTNTDDLNIDVSGTMTGVKAITVVVYEKAQHQR